MTSQPTSRKSGKWTALITSVVVAAGIIGIRELGWLQGAELATYDWLVQHRSAEKNDDRVTIVTIGDDDIQQLNQYPIHDGTLAQALESLDRLEPVAIGIDIARDVPQGPPKGRAQLEKLLKTNERMIAGCLLSSADHPGIPPAPGTPSDRVGYTDFPADENGTIRRISLISTPPIPKVNYGGTHICNTSIVDSEENKVSSFSLLLALNYLANQDIEPEQTDDQKIRLKTTLFDRLDSQFGGYSHADVPDYQLMLNYRSPRQAVNQVSLIDVLHNKVDPDLIRDRVVLIGYTSIVSKDLLPTPYPTVENNARLMPGVIIHAQAVSQMLSAVLDGRSLIRSWPQGIESFWIAGCTIVGGWVATRRRGWLLNLGLLIVIGGATYLFFLQGVWIPMLPALGGLLVSGVISGVMTLAQKTGYAQALYEQMRDQMLNQGKNTAYSKGDYLESLVRRAQAIRSSQRNEVLTELEQPNVTAEQQRREIRAELEKELERERERAKHLATELRLPDDRYDTLIQRAQTVRRDCSPFLPPITMSPLPPSSAHSEVPSHESTQSTDELLEPTQLIPDPVASQHSSAVV